MGSRFRPDRQLTAGMAVTMGGQQPRRSGGRDRRPPWSSPIPPFSAAWTNSPAYPPISVHRDEPVSAK